MLSNDELVEALKSSILGDIPERLAALEGPASAPEGAPVENVPQDVQEQLDGKVDKVEGMGLSHVDFTEDYRAKLAALPLETILYPEVQPTGSATGATASIGNGSFNANPISGDPYHLLEVTNNNSGKQCVRINSYGADSFGNNVHFCRYFGTQASPSAIGAGAFLMSTGYRGHDGSGLSQSMAAFQVVSTEAWSSGKHGIRFQWQVTPKGSSTRKHMMELDATSLNVFGSMGLGKAPAPWHSNYRVLELGGVSGCAIRGHVSEAELTLTANAYYDSAYRRGIEGGASAYQMVGGTHIFSVAGSAAAGAAITFKQAVTISNAGVLIVAKDAASGRSISAAGTINASGADYAEYMRKSDDCGEISCGQIVGIDSNGEITDQWARAISYAIKSTAPAYVGGCDFPDADADKYELIAFAGRVPVNIFGAKPGEYLIPVDSQGIDLMPVGEPSFSEYLSCVGRVVSVAEDGRAVIIVKTV